MDQIETLIRDLEGATEGSRELDGEIALLLGWVKHHAGWAHWTTPEGLENQHVPFFSDSLDDALTLVPDGMAVCAWLGYSPSCEVCRNGIVIVPLVEAPTEALALCIAALKARRAA